MRFHEWFAATLLVLVGSVAFLSLFSYTGTLMYDMWWKEERLERETQIASVDVSEMSEEEAKSALQAEINQWKSEASVHLKWYDETVTIPNEAFSFEVEQSIEHMFSGESREEAIKVTVNREEIVRLLNLFVFEEQVESQTNMDELVADLEVSVSELPAEDVDKNIHDYLYEERKPSSLMLESAQRNIPQAEDSIQLLQTLSTVIIPAGGSFSLLQTLDEHQIQPVEGESLTVLASAIYEVLLSTNFEVIERSQRHQLYDGVPLGYDAHVIPDEQDLVFFNPNAHDYELQLHFDNNELRAELHGLPFPYSIRVDVEQVSQIEPKTRVRYTKERSEGEREVIENGSQGYQVRTVRAIDSIEGEEGIEETVSEDYYPPVHRLEEWSIEERFAKEEEEDTTPDPWDPDEGDDSWEDEENENPWDNEESENDDGNPWTGGENNGNNSGSTGSDSIDEKDEEGSGAGDSENEKESNESGETDANADPWESGLDENGDPIKGY